MSGPTPDTWTLDDPGFPPALGDPVSYHQDQDQDQEQDQALPPPLPSPLGPGGNSAVISEEKEPSELDLLLDRYKAGTLEPDEPALGEMPERPGSAMENIATHMKLLMGLRRANGDYRPLPYATSMAVRAGLVADKGTASKAIRRLVAAGVVERGDSLKPSRPGLDGTKTYAPPGEGCT